jgi:hypothetical protein
MTIATDDNTGEVILINASDIEPKAPPTATELIAEVEATADTHAAVALFEDLDPQALPLIVPRAGLDPTPVRPKRSPLVLSQFRHRLRRRRTPEPHWKDF